MAAVTVEHRFCGEIALSRERATDNSPALGPDLMDLHRLIRRRKLAMIRSGGSRCDSRRVTLRRWRCFWLQLLFGGSTPKM